MNIIVDAREYASIRPLTSEFYGGTELLLRHYVAALSEGGRHRVDVISCEPEEHHAYGAYWWTEKVYPRKCNVLVACEKLDLIHEFDFKRLIVPLNKPDPILAGRADAVDAFVVLSHTHSDILWAKNRSTIKSEQIFPVFPGGDLNKEHPGKMRERILYSNSPGRGLIHLARQWDMTRHLVPDVELAITYGVKRHFDGFRWAHNLDGDHYLEIWRWLESAPPGVINYDMLSREGILQIQAGCELFAYPLDPSVWGEAVHCLAAMEAAAAGCALLLPAVEGMPELYEEAADFLHYPIEPEEWPEAIAMILADRPTLERKQRRNRKWAKSRPWSIHHRAWREIVEG